MYTSVQPSRDRVHFMNNMLALLLEKFGSFGRLPARREDEAPTSMFSYRILRTPCTLYTRTTYIYSYRYSWRARHLDESRIRRGRRARGDCRDPTADVAMCGHWWSGRSAPCQAGAVHEDSGA